jgi:hypothetical protein
MSFVLPPKVKNYLQQSFFAMKMALKIRIKRLTTCFSYFKSWLISGVLLANTQLELPMLSGKPMPKSIELLQCQKPEKHSSSALCRFQIQENVPLYLFAFPVEAAVRKGLDSVKWSSVIFFKALYLFKKTF